MSITLSADAKTELAKHSPNYLRVATIIKNQYDADTRDSTDISDRVMSWGRLVLSATLFRPDWEKPNLTMIVQNDDNFFTKNSAASIWETAPTAHHKECALLVQLYVLIGAPKTRELVLEYRGRIDDSVVRLDESMAVAELVTVFEQDYQLRRRMLKNDGGTVYRPNNTY